MDLGRKGDGTVGSVGGGGTVHTGPTLVQREDRIVERRDSVNARLVALREQADGYKAAGEKVPDHLARLLKEAEKAGEKREVRREAVDPNLTPKPETAETRDGKGYFYEEGHGVEPKHPDSTDAQGYHVPRPADAAGAGEQVDVPDGEFATKEPVEKFPDFANPAKRGDLIPEEAHKRDVVPDALKGSGKTEEQVKADREAAAEAAEAGRKVDPKKAQAPLPPVAQDAAKARESQDIRDTTPKGSAKSGRPSTRK